MYARTTMAHFKPGTSDEALGIVRDAMLPAAAQQQGFRGALILSESTDRAIIITLWDTEAALLASAPPEHIRPLLERLGELIQESSQTIHQALLHLPTR
jgi:hypothetical protein